MAPIKRALSSYMIFCNDRRKQITDENPGLRIGEIQKLISVQWKELSEQEKEHYVQLAAKDKERYAQEKLDNPVVVEEADADAQGDGADASSNACVYQLGRVKKIIQTDPDTNRVSREALIAIAKASELFVQFLGTKSYENALFQNRRQIKSSDITRTIQSTGALDWLREDFPGVKPAPPAHAASGGGARARSAKERAAALPSGSNFFKPQQPSSGKKASEDAAAASADDDDE